MKLEKRMILYISFTVIVGVFATFNKTNGSIYMGFMVLSFGIITVSVRQGLMYLKSFSEKLEFRPALEEVVQNPTPVARPVQTASKSVTPRA